MNKLISQCRRVHQLKTLCKPNYKKSQRTYNENCSITPNNFSRFKLQNWKLLSKPLKKPNTFYHHVLEAHGVPEEFVTLNGEDTGYKKHTGMQNDS